MKLYDLPEDFNSAHDQFHAWACEQHNKAGCTYSDYPYKLHLDAVVNVGRKYLYLIEKNEEKFNVMASISAHDLIEDTSVSYNDIAKHPILKHYCGIDGRCTSVADIVYNVSNESGRNRKERSEKTYPKIASCKYSTFVKLCDRISNIKFSYYILDEKGKFEMYKKEAHDFFKKLNNPDHGFDDMWKEIQALGLL